MTLAVVPREAEYGVRLQAFHALRPASRQVEKLVTRTQQVVATSTTSITLGNGEVIQHPIDLLPAVLPTSLTAQRILDYEDRNAPWKMAGAVAVGSALTSAALLLGSLLLPRSQAATANGLQLSGAGIGVVGILTSVIVGALLSGNTAPARERCFEGYEADLREYLNVAE